MPVIARLVALLLMFSLAGCDSGSSSQDEGETPAEFTIGGLVVGLTGSVTLTTNGKRLVVTENGSYTFDRRLAEGVSYNVEVFSQPVDQTCVVSNGSGTVVSSVAIVLVTCTVNEDAAVHSIGGTVSGLTSRVTLHNNGGNNLLVTADGGFTFTKPINDGGSYEVTVAVQPVGQICTVSNGSGVATADLASVTVTCVTRTYAVGGTVTGMAAGNLTLQNNGGDNLVLAGNGTFSFPTVLPHGSSYAVTVLTNPPNRVCLVGNGTGTATGAVTNITVTCALPQYTIGGTVTGLLGLESDAITLDNNGSEELVLTDNGDFTFTETVEQGSAYDVTVLSPPDGYTCELDNSLGIALANVTDINLDCTPITYTVSGEVSGLAGTVTLENNGGDEIVLAGNGTFSFPGTLLYGAPYSVVLTANSPGDQVCTVTAASGTISADVTSVRVTCLSNPPAAPVVSFTTTARPRELGLTWPEVGGASWYRLLVNPDGESGYSQQGGDFTANLVGDPMSVLRHDWANSSYIVQACNTFGCTDSAPVYTVNGMAQAIGYFKASHTRADDLFGYAISLSADGKTLAVGAPGEASDGSAPDDTSQSGAGAVFVFEQDVDGNWSQVAWLKSPAPDPDDRFGTAVALSADGNTIAVGAPYEDSNATGVGGDAGNDLALASGAVFVFTRSDGDWDPSPVYLKAATGENGDIFGSAVALAADGNTLAVTAPNESSNATGINGDESNNLALSSGAVYVFTRSEGSWSQQAFVKASNTGAGDQFGGVANLPGAVALAADGNTLVVGAPFEDGTGTGIGGNQSSNSAADAGAAYVYTRAGNSWSVQAYVKASNTKLNDWFGATVALSSDGNLLAVGAPFEDSGASGIGGDQASIALPDSGAVYLFGRSETTWVQDAYVKASNPGSSDLFGARVVLAGDGATLVVSATQEDSSAVGINGNQGDNSLGSAGAAYLFDLDGSWTQTSYIKAANSGGGDFFGGTLGISADGDTLAVGSAYEESAATGVNTAGGGSQSDDSTTQAGAVYLY